MRRSAEEEAFSRPVQRVKETKVDVGLEMDDEMNSEMDSEMDAEMDAEMDDEMDSEMPRKRARGEDDAFYESMVSRREGKKQAKEERKKYQEVYVNDDYVLKEGESRKASKKILANRGLVPSRPKVNRNPRVKKRRQYDKALRRRHGQVAALRTNEADQYGGEKSGIRADVTHSRVFN